MTIDTQDKHEPQELTGKRSPPLTPSPVKKSRVQEPPTLEPDVHAELCQMVTDLPEFVDHGLEAIRRISVTLKSLHGLPAWARELQLDPRVVDNWWNRITVDSKNKISPYSYKILRTALISYFTDTSDSSSSDSVVDSSDFKHMVEELPPMASEGNTAMRQITQTLIMDKPLGYWSNELGLESKTADNFWSAFGHEKTKQLSQRSYYRLRTALQAYFCK
jgi:hypothetical protein